MVLSPFPTASELADLQSAAESGMVDSCTARLQTGTTLDPDTGAEVPVWEDIYSGKCRFRMGSGSDTKAGEQPVVTTTFIWSVPVSATGIVENVIVTVDSSQDPDLEGRTLRVDSPWGQTFATARRFACEESTL